MNKIRVTAPGGASAKWETDGHIITGLTRGDEFECVDKKGDYYKILIPAYVHSNFASLVKDHPFSPEEIKFIGPDINSPEIIFDGSYECLKMMMRWIGDNVEIGRENRSVDEIYKLIGPKFELGIKYFPEPPFIAHVNYRNIDPYLKEKKKDAYVLVLEITDNAVLVHDPIDFEGGFKRLPMNDFLLGYRGNSIWLK